VLSLNDLIRLAQVANLPPEGLLSIPTHVRLATAETLTAANGNIPIHIGHFHAVCGRIAAV
jgi:hypothetical protein